MLAARGHLHHTKVGKRWETAQCAHRAAVGAVGVGIGLGKHHPLVCQTVEVRRDARVALGVDGIDKGAAAALHQYNQHIGPCGVEQRLGVEALGVVAQHAVDAFALVVAKKVSLPPVVARLERGRYEAEGRIDRRVVKKGVGAEVHHAHIGSALAHTAANAQKYQSAGHEPRRGPPPPCAACGPLAAGRVCSFAAWHKGEHLQVIEQHRHGHHGQCGAQGVAHAHTLQCALGLCQVVPHRGVEFGVPKAIQTGIAHQHQCQGGSHHSGPHLVGHAPAAQPHPQTQAAQQPYGCNEVARCGHIEQQAVQHGLAYAAPARAAANGGGLCKHKQRFGQCAGQHEC